MILRWTIAVLVALALVACGVKSPLDTPNTMQADKKRPDPSLPPQPLGQ